MIKELVISYSKNNKLILFNYIFFVTVGIIASFVALPKFTANLMDSISSSKNGFKIDTKYVYLVILSFSIVVFTDLTRRWLEDTIVPQFTRHVRKSIYEFVMKSHKSDKPVEIGKLLNTIAHLPYAIRTIAIEVLKHYLPHLLAIIALISYFFYLDSDFGILQLITFCLFLIILVFNAKKCLHTNYRSQKHYMQMSEEIKDKVSNISSIYATHQEEEEIQEYDKINISNANIWTFSLRNLWKLRFYEEILIVASFAVFNYIMIKKKMPKKEAITLYVAEIYYFIRIMQAAQANFSGIFTVLGEASAMTEYMNHIIENIHTNDQKTHIIKNNKPAISIKNLSFKYNNNSPYIYKNLNLTFNEGDRVYIKGSSGCGKTTLFKLILGSLTQNTGTIHVYGTSDTETIRDNISLVDQHSKLFNDTIYNNIKYSNDATPEQVIHIIKELDTNIFKKLEKGIHTKVGVDANNMSGGQKQFIILLRTYFRRAKVILMDEPIASVDPENINLILDLIKKISKNRTLLIISHNDKVSRITNKELKIC